MKANDLETKIHRTLSRVDLKPRNFKTFVDHYGHVFEHSPWVVERAWAKRPFENAMGLLRAFLAVLEEASNVERFALIRAHPELADRVAMAQGLTADSAAEQASAGLDRLDAAEFATFQELNGAYRTAHGFPFIICVKLHAKSAILEAMRSRLGRSSSVEIQEALRQIGLIAMLRLAETSATG